MDTAKPVDKNKKYKNNTKTTRQDRWRERH